MAAESKTTMEHVHTGTTPVQANRILSIALKGGFFIWHYFEMMLAMMVGASLFELLVSRMPGSTRSALGLLNGTFLYSGGIALAMMVVMVAWMLVRGHGASHSAEMSVAMLVPVAFVAVVSILKGDASLVWFEDSYCSAMCVGMLAAMVYRWNHFSRWSMKSSHHAH
jgi:hypothetical protein